MFLFSKKREGFTLVELMVSVGIFIFMTALLVAKYGSFNQSVLLSNLAYDVALTLRTAQTYGLSVQGQQTVTGAGGSSPSGQQLSVFQYPYGVAFCASADCGGGLTNTQIIMFVDTNTNRVYDNTDTVVNTYNLKRGAVVSSISTSANTDTADQRADITFMRPFPDALICIGALAACAPPTNRLGAYSKIYITGSDGSIRTVVVRKTGQISVEN